MLVHEQAKCDFLYQKKNSQKHTLDWTQIQEKQTSAQWAKI